MGASGRCQGPGAAAPEETQQPVHLGLLTAPKCCGEGCFAGVESLRNSPQKIRQTENEPYVSNGADQRLSKKEVYLRCLAWHFRGTVYVLTMVPVPWLIQPRKEHGAGGLRELSARPYPPPHPITSELIPVSTRGAEREACTQGQHPWADSVLSRSFGMRLHPHPTPLSGGWGSPGTICRWCLELRVKSS